MRLDASRLIPLALSLGLAARVAETQSASGYRVESFTAEHGLPSEAITDVVRTSDGFIWIATGGLLTRFDGHEFRNYSAIDNNILVRRVAQLHAGLADTLWILDEGFAVFAHIHEKTILIVPPPPQPSWFWWIVQDGRGVLYGGGPTGIWRLRRGETVHERLASVVPLGTSLPRRDAAGRVWIVDSAHVLRQVGDDNPPNRITNVELITDGPNGELLVVRARGRLRQIERMDGSVVATLPPVADLRAVVVGGNGVLWISSAAERLEAYEQGSSLPALQLVVRGDFGRFSAEGACVWAAGLSSFTRVCPLPFRTVTPRITQNAFLEAASDSTVLMWDTAGRVLSYSARGERRLFGPNRADLLIAQVFTDRRGRSWWSPFSAQPGGTQGEGGGAVRLLPHRGAYSFAAVPTDETLWYAAGPNVYRVALTDSGTAILRDSAFAGGRVGSMTATRDGALWATVKLNDLRFQLIRVHGGRVTTYTERDGLPKTALRAVLADDDGTVWLGTYGAGLVRFRDGQFRALTEEDGLGDNVVTSLLEDAAGNLWMGGNRSVHRIARRDLDAFFAGAIRRVRAATYGRDDGLIAPETVGFPGVRDRAGRFWFPTIAGAAVVDPLAALELDREPARVHVLGLRTARDTIAGSDAGRSLTRGARRLTVTYTATAMRNPAHVRYEYRLDGVDDDWIYAGSSREATYNNVGPGTHTFRVRATNGGGVLSATDATLEFTVPPLFYETAAFYALLLLMAISLGWMALRFRERGSRRRELALQRAVDERTARLATALQTGAEQAAQLRTLDKAKSRFFANVSHEFRTPLSLIVGPVEDLRDGRWGELSASVRSRLEGVLANSRRLLKLVEQLLDIARIESGTLQLSAEVRDLVPLLRRMADSFASLAERRGIAFRLSCPVGGLRVRYDPDQMEKIISNLVGNALKFTPNGGSVELRARTEINGDGSVFVEVQDTGPGISSEFHTRVFERFFQVDDSSRRAHEGTGIGLALVRELVALHGGSVRLESALGLGSTFIVRLPLASGEVVTSGEHAVRQAEREKVAEHVSIVPHLQRESGKDSRTVLVVEDNVELLEFLSEHLAERYWVLTAENGLRALELAREHTPDLIVSDVMMPEMDGHSLCEAVKNDAEIDYIPVILLTAKASRDSRLAGLAGGADDYLTKPVDLAELMIRADNLIQSRRRVRERFSAANQPLPTISLAVQKPPRDASERALLESFGDVLSANLADEDFGVETMASAMGVGRSTLYRKLEPVLGMSPMDALWEYRLAQAAQWLAETSINVSEVAYGVGFKSVPHFCGKFRERYGETPSAYRRARASVRQ